MAYIKSRNMIGRGSRNPIAMPVRRGLEAVHEGLDSIELTAVNRAPDGFPDATIIGTPTMNGSLNGIQCKSLTNYLQMSLRDSLDQTFFAVIRTLDTLADAAHRPCFFGTRAALPATGGASITFGTGLYVSSAGAVRFVSGRGTSTSDDVDSDVAVSVSPDNTAWQLIVCQAVAGSAANQIQNITTGSGWVTSGDSAAPRFPTASLLRLGSGYTTEMGTSEEAFFAGHTEALTTGEIAAQAAFIQARMKRYGITV